MTSTEIPLFIDLPEYEVETDLSGTTFVFRLQWNYRASLWFLDIYQPTNSARIPIALGCPCVIGYPLTLGLHAFAGQLVIIGDRDPQRTDWGTRAKLVYVDPNA